MNRKATGSSSGVLPTWPKRDRPTFTASLWDAGALHAASLLVFLSLNSAGLFWVGLCCFLGLVGEQSKAQRVSVRVILAGVASPKITQRGLLPSFLLTPKGPDLSHRPRI